MAKKMWGGRFSKKTDPLVEEFTSSLKVDIVLAEYDILGSIAHAKMLGKCNIIPFKDSKAIVTGLTGILNGLKRGKLKVDAASEDVHSVVHGLLEERIGAPAKKLHTARSRNDQVSTDTRMVCKDYIELVSGSIEKLQSSLKVLSNKNKTVKMPGYTHLQHAQPVLFKTYLMAHHDMLNRDKQRLSEIYDRVDVLPLGSCALAGTSLPIDRKYVARQLGFKNISTNTLDAVSDRDFIIEILGTVSILGMHLSRLSEDLIIWSSSEFNFINIDEGFCTGSSMMPQKKNPDVLELIRGNTGKLYGNLVSVLVMMKGLPLTYNRDMQHDKQPLFESLNIIKNELDILAKLIKSIKLNKASIKKQLRDPGLYATAMAEKLVKKGVAFSDAHKIVGKKMK